MQYSYKWICITITDPPEYYINPCHSQSLLISKRLTDGMEYKKCNDLLQDMKEGDQRFIDKISKALFVETVLKL